MNRFHLIRSYPLMIFILASCGVSHPYQMSVLNKTQNDIFVTYSLLSKGDIQPHDSIYDKLWSDIDSIYRCDPDSQRVADQTAELQEMRFYNIPMSSGKRFSLDSAKQNWVLSNGTELIYGYRPYGYLNNNIELLLSDFTIITHRGDTIPPIFLLNYLNQRHMSKSLKGNKILEIDDKFMDVANQWKFNSGSDTSHYNPYYYVDGNLFHVLYYKNQQSEFIVDTYTKDSDFITRYRYSRGTIAGITFHRISEFKDYTYTLSH